MEQQNDSFVFVLQNLHTVPVAIVLRRVRNRCRLRLRLRPRGRRLKAMNSGRPLLLAATTGGANQPANNE